ncbi:MAG TPA: hypothetical protein VJB59_00685 [Bdellovibrionota bacterium]|nr:hypothetical protein [Bdellovibrionota bacterium]
MFGRIPIFFLLVNLIVVFRVDAGEKADCTGFLKAMKQLKAEKRILVGFNKNGQQLPGRIENQQAVLKTLEEGNRWAQAESALSIAGEVSGDMALMATAGAWATKFELANKTVRSAVATGLQFGYVLEAIEDMPNRKPKPEVTVSQPKDEIRNPDDFVSVQRKIYDQAENQLEQDVERYARKFRDEKDRHTTWDLRKWGRNDGLEWSYRVKGAREKLKLLQKRRVAIETLEQELQMQMMCGPEKNEPSVVTARKKKVGTQESLPVRETATEAGAAISGSE